MLVDHWIEIHGHFFLPARPEAQEEIARQLRQACWCINEPVGWDPATTLAYMDRTGIQMQMLSYVPPDVAKLREANDYGAGLVREHPDRFGLLAALPTHDPEACLAEVARAADELHADGFAVPCRYNDVYLSDAKLEPVWFELNRRRAVVFAHPNAFNVLDKGAKIPAELALIIAREALRAPIRRRRAAGEEPMSRVRHDEPGGDGGGDDPAARDGSAVQPGGLTAAPSSRASPTLRVWRRKVS